MILEEEDEMQDYFMERMLVGSCPTGQYPDPTNGDNCEICPAGKYCKDGYWYVQDCPQGTYSLASEEECTVCPAGKSCSSNSVAPVDCALG